MHKKGRKRSKFDGKTRIRPQIDEIRPKKCVFYCIRGVLGCAEKFPHILGNVRKYFRICENVRKTQNDAEMHKKGRKRSKFDGKTRIRPQIDKIRPKKCVFYCIRGVLGVFKNFRIFGGKMRKFFRIFGENAEMAWKSSGNAENNTCMYLSLIHI